MEKTLILYYSLSGNTEKYARERAAAEGLDLCRVEEVRRRSKFTAFIPGIPQAIGQMKSKIKPLDADLGAYSRIIVATPVWAGSATPAINATIALLPAGKTIDVVFVSQSGGAEAGDRIRKPIEARGCTLGAITHVKK